MNYEVVIGLEVHVQLKTESKLFCSCSTSFGACANEQVCPVCLGLPGSLPVLNEKVLQYAVMAGLMLGCEISDHSKFDRKNYFYPDLPKAYQISQYDRPLCVGGSVDIKVDDQTKKIHLLRIHIEEDAGKLVHFKHESGVDYNRAGVPLIEIVTLPEISSPKEAFEYLKNLKKIIEYLGISDCNMEEGSLRCDANISLRPAGTLTLGTKTEIKNLNSFKAVEKALVFEIGRQRRILETGGSIKQATLLWDADHEKTKSMRSKEEAHDYRYFPEPDLLPISIASSVLQHIRETLPESPIRREERFMKQYQLPPYDASVLTMLRGVADFYEACVSNTTRYKAASNWIMAELLRELNQQNISIEESPVKPSQLASLINLIEGGKISGKMAKEVFVEMFRSGRDADEIVSEKGMNLISDEHALQTVVQDILKVHQKSVEDYRNGRKNAMGFLVGQVMKATKGQADPVRVNQILAEKLELGA